MIDIFVISISNPLLIGIYENNKLTKHITKEGKTSDILPLLFDDILKKYKNINGLYFVNAPGSYMAIKVSYIFLKTLSISKNIPLYATNGFNFNDNSPIKALGKKYFINKNGTIKVDFLDNDTKIHDFKLPNNLDKKLFDEKNTLPEYNLPAV
ncbi:hypothetical protein CPU12_03390 [Malaciobacter molluscorum LMG 25693]|uniref:N6-L-threonylcarbamoyladenine synthase, TsaB subunit n=1 Tax=Malaciobacter molluscorum LMG 25693 TaxID=870501 RepID=A0A2G1DKR4_9BACT|nr:hypothetical protein [Malaciobacter molluscorum]AXX91331.1 N6-L-threonylcarbamoyladenine synthase, TsaB subunit [Malaciobacter molluscorum LMG 25693]PHO18916.1 hypothetical protein CPU12_03390 [Malaciobacter molluscorum LMG 25693]RXJ94333.1 hypothetical protein CRV00_07105 [Malaciobacter molluscorum]